MQNWFRNRFPGRYGPDTLCGVLLCAGLVLSLLANLLQVPVLSWLAFVPWLAALARMLSTRIEQRYQENQRLVEWWYRVRAKFERRFEGRSRGKGPRMYVYGTDSYAHFACPQCGQKLRVPGGRGRVEITCPKCGKVFYQNS